MAELMRVAALTGYFQTMKSLEADPIPLLREVGLSRTLLSKPEQMISAHAATRLLERSAEVTGCRTFGLRMAPTRGLADLGATSLLIEHEPTLREVLSALTRYRHVINPTLILHIEDIGDGVLIRLNFSMSEADSSRQIIELALSSLARLCFMAIGEDWQPEMVCFTSEPPPAADLPIYHRQFRCRAEFNAECNGIVIASRDLDRPSLRADTALAEHARRLIEATMDSERPTLSRQVEQALLLLLPVGRATIQSCAALLGTTVRTLQRTLEGEDTSFSSLLNKARAQLADQYLANPGTRITDVAGRLGYRSLGAFTRWHQQTYGMNPKDRRKRPAAMNS